MIEYVIFLFLKIEWRTCSRFVTNEVSIDDSETEKIELVGIESSIIVNIINPPLVVVRT